MLIISDLWAFWGALTLSKTFVKPTCRSKFLVGMALISTMKNVVWVLLLAGLVIDAQAQLVRRPVVTSTAQKIAANERLSTPILTTFRQGLPAYAHSLSANVGERSFEVEAAQSPIRRKAVIPPLAAYFQVSPQAKVSAYRYDELALFCKLEVLIERELGLPVKVRLGEVNAVEKLEGKPYTPFLVR